MIRPRLLKPAGGHTAQAAAALRCYQDDSSATLRHGGMIATPYGLVEQNNSRTRVVCGFVPQPLPTLLLRFAHPATGAGIGLQIFADASVLAFIRFEPGPWRDDDNARTMILVAPSTWRLPKSARVVDACRDLGGPDLRGHDIGSPRLTGRERTIRTITRRTPPNGEVPDRETRVALALGQKPFVFGQPHADALARTLEQDLVADAAAITDGLRALPRTAKPEDGMPLAGHDRYGQPYDWPAVFEHRLFSSDDVERLQAHLGDVTRLLLGRHREAIREITVTLLTGMLAPGVDRAFRVPSLTVTMTERSSNRELVSALRQEIVDEATALVFGRALPIPLDRLRGQVWGHGAGPTVQLYPARISWTSVGEAPSAHEMLRLLAKLCGETSDGLRPGSTRRTDGPVRR